MRKVAASMKPVILATLLCVFTTAITADVPLPHCQEAFGTWMETTSELTSLQTEAVNRSKDWNSAMQQVRNASAAKEAHTQTSMDVLPVISKNRERAFDLLLCATSN